ncbi:Flp pilus assembly protein CpaB [Cognatishimia sp. F0-27]|uniref:Flp pilus assembly protein CpaB n=1 Tax=Cognatishimia sp. F0-27 TaxID=2816855 RepID=UPI001D0C4F9E|nr:Flp pilus assembly protein CpaB [Cognatishimia sp. F0-27]MCC1492254.1 Flp pilus assembly protein CpaB [Cognatishimia sp. F0-27]
MRLLFGLVLVAGLGLAGFAVYMAKNYIGAYENALAEERQRVVEQIKTQDIYVTTRAIAFGEPILPEDVMLAPWAASILPDEYFDESTPLIVDGEEPRLALRPIEKHEAVMPLKVSEPGGDAGLTSRLSRGERAFAIKVDVATGVSGFLRPGDRVDIYWTGRIQSRDPDMMNGDVTKLIQTGVRLVAIDQSAVTEGPEAAIARTVTVAATPQQVAALAQAQSTGRLSLSLIANKDDSVAEVIEVDQRSLLGIERRQQKVESVAQVCTIRTNRGGERIEVPIPCS